MPKAPGKGRNIYCLHTDWEEWQAKAKERDISLAAMLRLAVKRLPTAPTQEEEMIKQKHTATSLQDIAEHFKDAVGLLKQSPWNYADRREANAKCEAFNEVVELLENTELVPEE